MLTPNTKNVMKIAGITAKDTYKEINSKTSDINGENTQIDILTKKKKSSPGYGNLLKITGLS